MDTVTQSTQCRYYLLHHVSSSGNHRKDTISNGNGRLYFVTGIENRVEMLMLLIKGIEIRVSCFPVNAERDRRFL